MTSFVTKEKYDEMKAKYEEGKLGDSTQTEGVYVHVVVSSDDVLEGSHGHLSSEDENMKNRYESMIQSIRESDKHARGALLNERGQVLWEEPLDEYEKRMLELKAETGSCIPNIEVRMMGKPLPEGMSECIKGFIVKKRKPSPPPRPPMRKYKTSSLLGIDVLNNQDEIDEYTAMMDKWREENLK